MDNYPDEIIVRGQLVDTREGDTLLYVGFCLDEAGINFLERYSGPMGDEWHEVEDHLDIAEYIDMLRPHT